jgi:hypothetical protein
MPFLNLNTSILIYVDPNVENPKIRLSDITDTLSQVAVSNVKSSETVIMPGETSTIITTQRTLSPTISTASFDITRPIATEDVTRMAWNGTGSDPLFRTVRALNMDSTTVLSMVRVGPRSMRLSVVSGPFDTTTVSTGDQMWIERNSDSFTNPFSAYNCDKLLTIQSKGVGYVVVNDEGLLGEEPSVVLDAAYTTALKIFVQASANAPRINDSVIIDNVGFNYYNRGTFVILRLTDTYIEFVNPYATSETASGGIVIFDYMIRFAHIITSGELTLTFDGNTTHGITIEKLGNNDTAQFTSTLKTTQITATNNSLNSVALRCQISGAIEV